MRLCLLPLMPMVDLGYINESLQGLVMGNILEGHWKGTQFCGLRAL